MEHAETGRLAKSGHPWRAEMLHRISVINTRTNPFLPGNVQLTLTVKLGFLFLQHSWWVPIKPSPADCQALKRQQPPQISIFELQPCARPEASCHHRQQGTQPGASPNLLWAVTSAGKQTGNPAVCKSWCPPNYLLLKAYPEDSHPAWLFIWNIYH